MDNLGLLQVLSGGCYLVQLDELSSLFLSGVLWGSPMSGSADSCSSQVVQVVPAACVLSSCHGHQWELWESTAPSPSSSPL